MEKFVERTLLYDFYGELLTPHQKQLYEEYVLDDFSVSEIAKERQVSRQGVHEQIKRIEKLLEDYEGTLHLIDKFLVIKNKANEISSLSSGIMSSTDLGEIKEKICDIDRISHEIIKEL